MEKCLSLEKPKRAKGNGTKTNELKVFVQKHYIGTYPCVWELKEIKAYRTHLMKRSAFVQKSHLDKFLSLEKSKKIKGHGKNTNELKVICITALYRHIPACIKV